MRGSNFLKNISKVMDQLGFTGMHELNAKESNVSGGSPEKPSASKAAKRALKNADHLLK
jgi:hypothetical protein